MELTRVPRSLSPRLLFLYVTLVLTFAAIGLLCSAIMSDHWEEVEWDKEDLIQTNVSLTWYLDGQVAMVGTNIGYRNQYYAYEQQPFLVPMHGGIWTMCVSLSEEEIQLLTEVGFAKSRCVNYLATNKEREEVRTAWQNRMQNLSISCALVCLILLGSAVFTGLFGLCRHQISAILITGVIYLVAATFALFTLIIIYFKRKQKHNVHLLDVSKEGIIGGSVSKAVLKARRFATSWSMDFGWGGVILCTLASIAWILLSKIIRFSPIAAMIA